jgi:hypothetical protein
MISNSPILPQQGNSPQLFYQLQKNNTLHLIQVSPTGEKKYIHFIPNLNIPTIKTHHKKVLEAKRDSKAVQNGTLFGN